MRIWDCKVNHIKNPIGYRIEKPVFSWIAEGAGEKELSRIAVRSGDKTVADTGWTDLNSLAAAVDFQLEPRTRYEWTVSVRREDGSAEESEVQFFETGKRNEAWNGKWITCEEKEKRLPFFCKTICTEEKKLKSARLYICGLGVYEAYLNGKKIGEAYLAPGCNDYHSWIQVQTEDISDLMKNGENELAVLLGDGWYKGRYGFTGGEGAYYGKQLKLIAEVHLHYEDGTETVVGTDESWRVRRSKIIFSGIYDGEIRDDTMEELPLEKVRLCEPEQAELTDRLSLPVKEQESFTVKKIITPKGETVLDTGQNMSGIFRFRVHEPAGTRIYLQFGEILQDGNFYRDNLRTAKAEYIYISDGKEHILRPHFTFCGYRYVKVQGIKHVREEDFRACAVYSDVPMRGQLVTGNEKVNRLIANVIWGMKSNFVDIPSDCPQRDERMGWTGDAQVFSDTACFLADPYEFYRKYLYDMAREQEKNDGMVPDTVPAAGMKKSSSVWGDAVCIIPWNLYLHYGDPAILEEHYENMKQWLAYIGKIDGKEHGWRRIFHYGDWLALDSPYRGEGQTRGGTDEGFIADVYYRKSALITAKTAKVLGKEEEAAQYEKLASRILDGIREEYFSPAGRCCIYTQTAAVLTLTEGLNNRERAAEQLRTLLENNDNKLTTGFVGTPLLCQALSENGMEEKAYKLLLNEEYPGWLYEVNLGATTIWERWDSVRADGHISGTGMNSLNHYAYGSIAGWLWRGVVGIVPLEEDPGFRRVRICPHVSWKMKYADAVLPSPCGIYRIFWRVIDLNHIYLRVTIPEGCRAEIHIHSAKQKDFRAEAGSFECTCETEKPLASPLCADDTLRRLMANPESRAVLREEIADADYLLTYTGSYPLRETMTNLGYRKEQIEKIDQRLNRVLE